MPENNGYVKLAAMQQNLFPEMGKPNPPQSPSVSREALNEPQFEAVTTLNGPVLVIAGAGSGKTRTLVYRVAHLVEEGIAPENILLLTFTRKAAEQMLTGASRLMDDSCRQVVGGTFHAVANMLLRRYGSSLGYAPNFTIMDQGDSEGVVNLIKSSLGFGKVGKRFPNKRTIISVLSKSVNRSMALGELLDDQYPHLVDFIDELKRIEEHYRRFKVEHGLMDYDDLLVNWQRLLDDETGLQKDIAGRFSHIMVDEYQDTNLIQAAIIRRMTHDHDNVMVVGDDSQSIYSFRGADFRNIMDFPDSFPNAKVIRLEENYRSVQPILSLTNSIIQQAEEKYSKTLFSNIEGGEKPLVHGARNEAEQARYIADQIEKLHRDGTMLSEIAVLFRSGFHSYKLELELANRHLAFEKRGGMKLTESAHIKDVLAYLRVLMNPADNLSWNRALLLLDKVGPKTAKTVLDNLRGAEDPVEALRLYPAGKSWQAGLFALADMLVSLQKPGLTPADMFDELMEYYRPIFERIYHDDYPRRSRDLEQLRTILAGYENLQKFIDDTALDPPQVVNESQGLDFSLPDDRLILSTIHSAKGLEWDMVFVIHLAEGMFPTFQSYHSDQREEERRLLYVAATRAKKKLYLTYPQEVMSVDRRFQRGTLTPFLAELSPGVYRSEGLGGWSDTFSEDRFSFDSPPAAKAAAKIPAKKITNKEQMKAGAAVRHNFFGQGFVRTVKGGKTVEVYFPRHGTKTLHLDYAKLEILDK